MKSFIEISIVNTTDCLGTAPFPYLLGFTIKVIKTSHADYYRCHKYIIRFNVRKWDENLEELKNRKRKRRRRMRKPRNWKRRTISCKIIDTNKDKNERKTRKNMIFRKPQNENVKKKKKSEKELKNWDTRCMWKFFKLVCAKISWPNLRYIGISST